MTLEEAKNKLKKEGFVLNKIGKRLLPEKAFIEYEDPDVCEAMQIIESAGFGIGMELNHFDERKARLKEEREKHSNAPMPAPGSSENRIKEDSGVNPALKESASQFNNVLLDEQAKKIAEQNREITRLLSLVEKKENSISRLYYEKSVLEKENEELKKGEIPARYFDKALVDEQAEKIKKLEHEKLDILEIASSCKQTIAELTKEKANLEDQITVLNACKKHNDKIDRKQIKCLGKEIAKLNSIIHDKNAILADVAEELRLSKIREKNLTELCQKYVKANEELREKVAEKTKLVEMVRKGSKEYCEYGIAAEKMIQKMAKEFVNDKPVSSKDYEQYRLWAKGYRFNPQLPDFSEEEEKSAESVIAYKDEVIETLDKELAEAKHELSSLKRPFRPESTEAVVLFANAYAKAEKKHLRCAEWRNDGKEVSITYILKNGKKSKITLDFTGDEIIFSRTDPDKKPRIPAPEEPKHDNIFEDFINKTIDNYNRRAANLGCVGSKDGNGIFDQMVGVDNAEEGADLSGAIVLCGKDFIDAIKKIK